MIPLGIALLATLAFMFSGRPKEAHTNEWDSELAWLRPYLTNLQTGGVNELTVSSLRASREKIVPALVGEMNVRPPTLGKKFSENVGELLSRYTSYQPQRQLADSYRAQAANALQMMFLDSQTGAYFAPTSEESRLLLPVLGNALYDRGLMVRVHAAATLGAFRNNAADAMALCEIALADADWQVRATVIYSLAALAEAQPAAVDLVKAGLKDPHHEVRRNAVAVLERAGLTVAEDVTKSIPPAVASGFE